MNLYVALFFVFVVLCTFVHALYLRYFAGVEVPHRRDVKPLNDTLIMLLVLILAGVVVVMFFFLWRVDLKIDNNIGQIGDFIGGLLNPVLSFLALVVLLRTTLIQTNEAKKTTSFMERQQHIMEREKFENTFFQLTARLDAYAEMLFRANVNRADKYAYKLWKRLVSNRAHFDSMSWKSGVDASAEHVKEIVSEDFDRLSGFGRRASQCIYFIDSAYISNEEKKFYYSYFMNVFDQYEYSLFLTIIFYRSPASVKIIKENKLAEPLRSDSLCSVHVYNLFGDLDTSAVYPLSYHTGAKSRSKGFEPS
jgi:hypothetical protein